MLLAVRISSYGCTWEVWRALKKLELLSAAPRATLKLLSCSPNFPRLSITRYTHAKHKPILKCCFILIVLKNTLEKHLEKEIPVVAVVAVMGTTEESAIDPLTEILKMRKNLSKKVRNGPTLNQFIYRG